MITVHAHYLNDSNGEKSLVVFPIKEFEDLIEQLEDLEDVHLYDEARKEDDGQSISFQQHLKQR